jgi:hypothetical protein
MAAGKFRGAEPDVVGDRADGRPPREAVTHEDEAVAAARDVACGSDQIGFAGGLRMGDSLVRARTEIDGADERATT